MFCPNCSSFLLKSQLIKANVKKFQDTDVEYDATCPFCNVRIGRMFWGRLEIAAELVSRNSFTHQEPLPAPQNFPHRKMPFTPAPTPAYEAPYCEVEPEAPAEPGPNPEPQPDTFAAESDRYSETPPPPYPPPSYYYCPNCGCPLPEETHKLPYTSFK